MRVEVVSSTREDYRRNDNGEDFWTTPLEFGCNHAKKKGGKQSLPAPCENKKSKLLPLVFRRELQEDLEVLRKLFAGTEGLIPKFDQCGALFDQEGSTGVIAVVFSLVE